MPGIAFGRFDDSFSLATLKAYVAEFISTLLFVFAGVGSAIAYGIFFKFLFMYMLPCRHFNACFLVFVSINCEFWVNLRQQQRLHPMLHLIHRGWWRLQFVTGWLCLLRWPSEPTSPGATSIPRLLLDWLLVARSLFSPAFSTGLLSLLALLLLATSSKLSQEAW